MMNDTEYLLVCLGEESSEVVKTCSKILRFGMDSSHPRDLKTNNKSNLLYELNDLMAVVEILVEKGVIPTRWEDFNQRLEKSEKVKHYMNMRQQDNKGVKNETGTTK